MLDKWIVAAMLLASPRAWAHPGEHPMRLFEGIAHLLSEPDHLALLGLAVVFGVVAGVRHVRRGSRTGRRKAG